jgi:hypothetical protein
MKYSQHKGKVRILIRIAIQIILLLFVFQGAIAQEPPPRPIKVTLNTNLSFGAFYQGVAGGTVTVNTDLTRTATGSVVLLPGMGTFSPAIFRIVANPGRIVSLLNTGDIALTRAGGGSMNLHFGVSNPTSPFITTAGPLLLYLGGTLTVGNPAANPPGSYSGTFNVTFIQE